MAKMERQKLKLRALEEYLRQNTDAAHPASMAELLAHLEANGISAERKSVYSDLTLLREEGVEVLRQPGPDGGYYLASRTFELAELKLLVDAVQSSKFLSERKSLELIEKLGTLVSRHEARTLQRQVVVTGRVKSMNKSIYYNVDKIHEAIAQNSQITFRYFEWGMDKQRHYRGGVRTASPYLLCWDSENYYLVAHTQEHGITHFRVDKMTELTANGVARTVTEQTKQLDPADYAKQVFNMYKGEATTVRLRFHTSLVGVVLDRFGRDCMLIPDGDEHFIVPVRLCVSPMFLCWLFSFGDRVQILSPQHVVDEYLALCRASMQQYPS